MMTSMVVDYVIRNEKQGTEREMKFLDFAYKKRERKNNNIP